MSKQIIFGIIGVVLIVPFIYYLTQPTYRMYKNMIKTTYKEANITDTEIITEKDLENLPEPVRKYLEYVGVIGTKKVTHFSCEMSGEMKLGPDKPFAPVNCVQTSFIKDPARYFYITMQLKGIPIKGIHYYEHEEAVMEIKLLDLIKVADGRGEEMNKGETVTVFNDMCILAPSTLISDNIRWEIIDDTHVMGYFTNKNVTVSATLTFDDIGRLINFESDDRCYMTLENSFEWYSWSTPIDVTSYKKMGEVTLPTKASAIWDMNGESFEYVKLEVHQVHYNEPME